MVTVAAQGAAPPKFPKMQFVNGFVQAYRDAVVTPDPSYVAALTALAEVVARASGAWLGSKGLGCSDDPAVVHCNFPDSWTPHR